MGDNVMSVLEHSVMELTDSDAPAARSLTTGDHLRVGS